MKPPKGKTVLVLIQDGPFNTLATSEAFRMGIGLTLAENQTHFLLVQDGAYHLNPLQGDKISRPSLYNFITVFEDIGITLSVDADDMRARKITRVPPMTHALPKTEVFQMIRDADVVIPFR